MEVALESFISDTSWRCGNMSDFKNCTKNISFTSRVIFIHFASSSEVCFTCAQVNNNNNTNECFIHFVLKFTDNLLDMDVLWVHLQKFDSGPENWQRLSQFGSSEKQPAKKRRKTKMNELKIATAACGIYAVNDDNISWKCDMVGIASALWIVRCVCVTRYE